ncbi:TPA: phage protein NinX family protein [Citrobacter freundii]
MDYSKLSDHEINVKVGTVIGFASELMVVNKQTDYCNNPADAWPIIVDNRITVMIDDTTTEWSSASVQDFCDASAFQHFNCHKNPLRAAMITFLMMQDSDNVPANSTGSDLR